jgi:5-methylcytosine-specific restriction endonuclease McrA
MDSLTIDKIKKQIISGKIYTTKKYVAWRDKVFKRDRYRCQFPGCGKVGGHIQAHHIKPKYKYPEKIFEAGNGITLCYKCHQNLHAKDLVKKYALKFRELAKTNKPKPRIIRRLIK